MNPVIFVFGFFGIFFFWLAWMRWVALQAVDWQVLGAAGTGIVIFEVIFFVLLEGKEVGFQ